MARHVTPIAAMLCALALLTTGCGGGDAESSPEAPAPEQSAETKPAEPTEERLEFERAIGSAIRAQPGGERVDVECAIERLRTTLSNDDVTAAVEAARAGDPIPEESVDAAYEAGRRCAEG